MGIVDTLAGYLRCNDRVCVLNELACVLREFEERKLESRDSAVGTDRRFRIEVAF